VPPDGAIDTTKANPDTDPWRHQEIAIIAALLDAGDSKSAATQLTADLQLLKGDMDSQNAILSQVAAGLQNEAGAKLRLGDWDAGAGTYSSIEILPAGAEPGTGIQIKTYPGDPQQPEPPKPEPQPEPPKPESGPHPHPGPDSAFSQGVPFSPPEGQRWGWQNPELWKRGFDADPNFFLQQDPNWNQWAQPMMDVALSVANRMDAGDAQGAADRLSSALYAMKGDRYSQDELLSAVNVDDRKGVGVDMQLKSWDPVLGTWSDIKVVPGDGSPAIPIRVYDYSDPKPWEQNK
jgi:hypothetical protein